MIAGNEVLIDHSVNDWLQTSVAGNPTTARLDGLVVHAIFKRLKLSGHLRNNRQQRMKGDNCPIIYAMKGQESLFVSENTLLELWTNARIIAHGLSEGLSEPVPVDVFVVMPSKYDIGLRLGELLSEATGRPCLLDVFEKATVQAGWLQLADAREQDLITRDEFKKLSNPLRLMEKSVGMEGNLSLKGISPNYRYLFKPLVLNPSSIDKELRHVCLVDDLLASGTTLLDAQAQLAKLLSQKTTFSSVCLFSGI